VSRFPPGISGNSPFKHPYYRQVPTVILTFNMSFYVVCMLRIYIDHNLCDLKTHHKCLLNCSEDAHSLGDSGHIFILFSINVFVACVQKYCWGIAFGSTREHWEQVCCTAWQEPNRFGCSVAHSMRKRERNRMSY
jgi:hypothetical protein